MAVDTPRKQLQSGHSRVAVDCGIHLGQPASNLLLPSRVVYLESLRKGFCFSFFVCFRSLERTISAWRVVSPFLLLAKSELRIPE